MSDQKKSAARARRRFATLIPPECQHGPRLPCGGNACLDPGAFIFTNLLREAVGEVSKKVRILYKKDWDVAVGAAQGVFRPLGSLLFA
jgi:hypothetical protein